MRQSKITTLTKQELTELVTQSSSLKEILVKLGYSPNSGGSFRILKQKLEEFEIEPTFVKKDIRTNIPLEEILVENSTYTNRGRLKKRLIESKLLEYRCSVCGNDGEWMGKPLTLHLDHENGIHNDNRIENLRFLCPNCHAQTETYCVGDIDKKQKEQEIKQELKQQSELEESEAREKIS